MTPSATLSADFSLSVEMFLYLQVLDVLTTWMGFRVGLAEASPFVRFLMHVGPLGGSLGSKMVAVLLGGYCVWRGRFQVLRAIRTNWDAGLIRVEFDRSCRAINRIVGRRLLPAAPKPWRYGERRNYRSGRPP